jgi:hypothetical protein
VYGLELKSADLRWTACVCRNVYRWYYVSPTPWDIILSVVGSIIGLAIISYMEYRRRVKKAAMERCVRALWPCGLDVWCLCCSILVARNNVLFVG